MKKLFFVGNPEIVDGDLILESGDDIIIAESARDVYALILKSDAEYQEKQTLRPGQSWGKRPPFDEMGIVEIDINKIKSISATCSQSHD